MRKFLGCLIILLFLLCSCPLSNTGSSKVETLTIVSWNVQNLFNSVDDGNEYPEYLTTSGWTEQFYRARLNNIATVFKYPYLSDADIIVFNEIENDDVVKDIVSSSLKNKGFLYWTSAGENNGAIKTAVVSKIPIVNAKIHNISGLRPILQVEIQNLNERIIILALHAKSNLEGAEETAPKRLLQATTIARISDDILKKDPDALIIIAGDFNESYCDKNMMCDARFSTSCPINLLPNFKDGYWYCPWLDTQNNLPVNGSYYYANEWRCYDNILVSSSGKNSVGWEYENGGVVFQGILQTTDNKPNAFKRNLTTGVSDHLPVWIQFSLSPT